MAADYISSSEIINEIIHFRVKNYHIGHDFKLNFEKFEHIFVDNPNKMAKPIYLRYLRIVAIFKSMDITINNVLELYNLNFNLINDNYKIDSNLKIILDDFLENCLNITPPKIYDNYTLKSILINLFEFRTNYERLCNSYLEGYNLEGTAIISQFSNNLIYQVTQNYKESLHNHIDNILCMLIFPNTQNFDLKHLFENFGFPTDDLIDIDAKDKKLLEDF